MSEPIKILSLGAGVQSSVVALLSANGEIEPYDYAIFADTQAEPKQVYEWLKWLKEQLPFPVITVTAGSLIDGSKKIAKSKKTGKTYVKTRIPYFTKSKSSDSSGMMWRKCTADYKIQPVIKEIRNICGDRWRSGERIVQQSLGISTDEASRMKPSRNKQIFHRWPLIELGMSRSSCLAWMEKNGYPQPPRSACTFCPFHSDHEWQRLKSHDPESFNDAVQFEREVQKIYKENDETSTSDIFLHRSLIPLDQVKFSDSRQINMFENECEGYCGI